MQLSLAVFAVVMVGSVGLVAFFNRRSGMSENKSGIAVAAVVALVVIVVGYIQSRRHLSAAGSRKLSAAQGPAEILSDTSDDCRVRFGQTSLRFPGRKPSKRSSGERVPRLLRGGTRGARPLRGILAHAMSRRDPAADADAEEHAGGERPDRHRQARLRHRRPDRAPGSRPASGRRPGARPAAPSPAARMDRTPGGRERVRLARPRHGSGQVRAGAPESGAPRPADHGRASRQRAHASTGCQAQQSVYRTRNARPEVAPR